MMRVTRNRFGAEGPDGALELSAAAAAPNPPAAAPVRQPGQDTEEPESAGESDIPSDGADPDPVPLDSLGTPS